MRKRKRILGLFSIIPIVPIFILIYHSQKVQSLHPFSYHHHKFFLGSLCRVLVQGHCFLHSLGCSISKMIIKANSLLSTLNKKKGHASALNRAGYYSSTTLVGHWLSRIIQFPLLLSAVFLRGGSRDKTEVRKYI